MASSQAIADSAKAITAFDFNALSPAVIGVVNEGAKTVALTVPFGTNVTDLVPTITHTGASVNPASGAANDFTTPQTYTVTAADASTQAHIVTVTVAPPPPPVITTNLSSLDDFGSVTVGNYSSEKTYTVSGSNLTNDLVVTAPADFKVSQTSGTGFVSSFTLTPSGGTVSTTTIYVRYEPTTPGANTGTNVTNESTGATTQNVAVSGTGAAAVCTAPPSDLISWWPGDGNADDIQGVNNGTPIGGPTYTAGKVGQAFNFGGSGDYVQVPAPTGLPAGNAPRTMMLWFKTPSTWAGTDAWPVVMQYGGLDQSTKFGIYIPDYGSGRKLWFWGHSNDLGGSTVLQLDTWYHGAVTYDGSTVRVYLNGQLEAFQDKSLNTDGSRELTIGRTNTGIISEWSGLVDEAGIFNSVLTQAQIQEIYDAGSAGMCIPPPTPTLGTYDPVSVALSSDTTVNPIGAPTGATKINVSTSTSFNGKLEADPATGVVRVTNAHPGGTFTVTVKASGPGGSATRTFALTVDNGVVCSGASGFTDPGNSTGAYPPYSVTIGDFNGDGKQDIAAANNSLNTVSIRLGNGSGGFTDSAYVGAGAFPWSVAIGDFNGDGKQDLAIANYGTAAVTIRLGNGDGTFPVTTSVPIATGSYSIAVGDFNNDSKQDIAVANYGSNTVSVRFGDGAGGFAGTTDVPVGSLPRSVAIGNFNGDGNQDIAVANEGSNTISIRLGDGSGGFTDTSEVSVGANPYSVAIGDFDGDGKQDLASANFGSVPSTVSIRRGNGDGTFSNKPDVGVGSGPYSIAIGDFNNDGNQDIATANAWASTVSVRLGDGSGGFSGTTNVNVGSYPYSVAIGDFNGDGKQDFAAGNAGDTTNNSISIRLGACNPAPTIAAATGLSRQQGSPVSNSQIATVTDNGGNGSVVVSVASANPSNGVTISNIDNSGGIITADIVADCAATKATFTLQASDGNSISTDTLTVSVTANTAPTLTYDAQSVTEGNSLTFVPATGPSDNVSVASIVVQSQGTYTGGISLNNSTGAVSISNAAPAGSHTITIRATDNCELNTVATFTLNVNAAACTAPPSGIVSWWRGESNADDVYGTNNGTFAAATYAAGKVGQAFSLNGSGDYVQLTDSDSLKPTTAITLDTWIKLSSSPSGHVLIFDHESENPWYGYGLGIAPGNKLSVDLFSGSLVTVVGSTSVPIDTWTHVAMTYDGAFIKLYVNGAEDGSLANTGPINYTLTVDPTIGKRSTGSGNYFPGLIDEVEVFNGALTPSQILDNYNAGSAGKCLPDLSAPETTIDTHPSDPSGSSSATFTFSGTDNGGSGLAGFECKLDADAFAACSSPRDLTALADGAHTFQVRAIDNAGNADASPASYPWVVDTNAPLTVIDQHPFDPSNSSTATFNFSGTDTDGSGIAGFQCKIDFGTFSPCTSPADFPGLIDGQHVFEVRAVDNGGNIANPPASYSWNIDTLPPITDISGKPSDPTNDTSATFTFNATNFVTTTVGYTYECKLDTGAFASCVSGVNYPGPLADGLHIFHVKATDLAGNVEVTPASYTWMIDTIAPDTSIDSHPPDPSSSSSATFTFSYSENNVKAEGGSRPSNGEPTFECDPDGAGFSACTSPADYTMLTEGSHTFQVRAKDLAGNVDPTPASYTWLIDLTAPPCSLAVTTTADGAAGSGSLRSAIICANTTPGADTISIPAGTYTLTIAGAGEDAAATGDLDITDSLSLNGAGAGTTIIDGNALDRVFDIGGTVTASISDVTVRNGKTTTYFGGGILNSGTLTVTNSSISGNTTEGSGLKLGGGVFNFGTLTVANSNINGNNASFEGGGIYTSTNSTLSVTNSTVDSNSAYKAGGIFNWLGTVTITNSTVSGNTSSESEQAGGIFSYGWLTVTNSTINGNSGARGGGIGNYGVLAVTNSTITGNSATVGGGIANIWNGGGIPMTATVTNSTISDNSAGTGGGIYQDGNYAITISNTIVANQTAGGDCAGSMTSNGHNLESSNTCGFTGPGDLQNTDPLIEPLKNNGGPTSTHALLAASLAINRIPIGVSGCGTTVTTDQRGISRPQGSACDIGAFESTEPPPAPQLKLVKAVTNNNGGTLQPADWNLTAAGGTDGFTEPGHDDKSAPVHNVTAGITYELSESGPLSGYAASPWNCVISSANPIRPDIAKGHQQIGNSITLGLDESAICTITNDDIATACLAPPSGMVSWWPGDGNSADIIGTNNGVPAGSLTYQSAKVQQGFLFDGSTADVMAPASATLDVGSRGGMTVDMWINPTVDQSPLVEWSADITGAHFWVGGNGDPGNLFINLIDTGSSSHVFQSAGGIVAVNKWQHVAMTYDRATGIAALYLNGSIVAGPTNIGSFTPRTSGDLYLGHRVPSQQWFMGAMDEVEIFSRALDQAEIGAIYDAGSFGKCQTPAPQLKLVKAVTNDNGGTLQPADWNLTATGGTDGFTETGHDDKSAPVHNVTAGVTYELSESGPLSGYAASQWDCVISVPNTLKRDTKKDQQQSGNSVTLGLGESAVCTITNDDIAPQLRLIKYVKNDNGRTAESNNWDLTATGESGGFTEAYPDASTAAYHPVKAGINYTLSESDTGPSGYTASAWSCNSAGKPSLESFLQTGDSISLSLGEWVTCTITNDDDPEPSCVQPPSGMVGWWPGDSNYTDIVGGNTGTPQGDATFAPGKVGQAFSLTNSVQIGMPPPYDDDYILVPHSAALRPSHITVDAWIKGPQQDFAAPVLKNVADDYGGYALEFDSPYPTSSQIIRFFVYTADGWKNASSMAPIPVDTWTHVAGTYDGTNISLYVNGVLQGSPTVTTGDISYSSAPSDLLIGHDPISDLSLGGRFYNGLIDEVEIFDRALTANEVSSIYNAGSAGKCEVFHALTVTSVHGTVTRVPDLTQYLDGSVVQLTAAPATGYNFVNWTGDITSSNNPITVTMDAAKSVTANFIATVSTMTTNAGTTPQSAPVNTVFAIPPAVTLTDGNGNPVVGASVTFTAPDLGFSGVFSNGTNTITVLTDASGIASAPITANSTVGGPYVVTAAAAGLPGVNFLLTNTGGRATHFVITAPANVIAGVPFSFTVTALDAFDNIASGYGGTVHFTSTDPSPADLPANIVLTGGVATLEARLFKAGIQTISAYDLADYSTETASNNINVGPGPTWGFRVSAPLGAGVGRSFKFTVKAVDPFDNIAPDYSGTVHFTGTDGSGVWPADTTLVDGVGTFTATLNTAGIQRITAADIGATTTGTSNNINVFAEYRSRADFDGDGRTDVSVFRPSEGNWYIDRSSDGYEVVQWGVATDTLIPGDYDGDGKADFAVWRPTADESVADFYVLNSNGFTYSGYAWGLPGDIPMAGDYDGDGKIDITIYRPSTTMWWILKSRTLSVDSFQFGSWGDVPMLMDYNGDGKTDLAVYRPSERMCYMNNAWGTPAENYDAVQWGLATDIYVPADYDGDGKSDVAVFRPDDGRWYIRRSSDGGYTITQFGMNGDTPVPGDYDGDGRDDIAVYRNGTWYMNDSSAGFTVQLFGLSTDEPIPAAYYPYDEW